MNSSRRMGKLHIGMRAAALGLAAAVSLPSVAEYLPRDIRMGIVDKAEAATSYTHPITYKYYTQTLHNVVPGSWLFVGTYLMSAKTLQAQIYQQAIASKKKYDQDIAFYTSELDEGQWKNVKNAESINTILPEGAPIPEENLFPYLITCVVGDDGVPRDPLTGSEIDIFEPDSPYEMENIPELDIIQEYYESGEVSPSDTGSREYLYRLLYTFFEHDNQETYDRDTLDIGGAVNQYNAVADSPELREFLWDLAEKGDTTEFPESYKDILTVMNNWSNIRDKVTDQADIDEDKINALYSALIDADYAEESNAALFVCRQVDSLRRSEIYYNLLTNTNLTGSLMSDGGLAMDELNAKRAEVVAEQSVKSAESDILYALVKEQLDKIDAKEAEKADLTAQLNQATAAWAEEKQNMEAEKQAIQQEIEELNVEYLPLKEEYERLDQELDDIYNETLDFNQSEKDLEQAIKDKRAEKDTRTAETEAAIQELQNNYDTLYTRYTSAMARGDEYDRLAAEIEDLKKKIDNLNFTKNAEQEKQKTTKEEADRYTTSRLTAFVDNTKTYDPDKRRQLDKDIDTLQKGIEAIDLAISSAYIRISDLTKTMSDIDTDRALLPQVEAAREALDTQPDILKRKLSEDIANIEKEAAAMDEELAAMNDPYQEKLQRLKEKNDEYTEVEGPFLELYAEVSRREYQIQVIDFEIKKAETELGYMQEDIDIVQGKIDQLTPPVETLQIPVDAKNAEIELLNDEIAAIDALIKETRDNPRNAYPGLIEGLEKDLATKTAQKESAESSLAQMESAKAVLEVRVKEATENLKTQRSGRDEENVTNEKDRADIIQKYDDIIAEINNNIVILQADIESHKVDYDSDEIIAANTALKEENGEKLDKATNLYEEERTLDVNKKSIIFLKTEIKRFGELRESNMTNYRNASTSAAKSQYYTQALECEDRVKSSTNSMNNLTEENETLEATIEEHLKELEELGYTGLITEDMDTADIPESSVDPELSAYIISLQNTYDILDNVINNRIRELDTENADYIDAQNAKIASLRETITQNEGLKQDELTAREQEHERLLQNWNEAIDDALATVEDYKEKLRVAEGNVTDQEKNIETITADLDHTNLRLADTRKNAATYNAGVEFGVAPTLYFLRSAAKTGTTKMGLTFSSIERYNGYDFEVRNDLNDAIEQAITDCGTAYEEYLKASLRRGDTAYSYTGYILSREVLMNAEDMDKAMPYLQMIVDLNNIDASLIMYEDRELSLLYGWLIPFSMADFNDKRTEDTQYDYQFYIQGVADRATVKDAITFVEGRLEYAYAQRDSFIASDKTAIIESHIEWLENLLADLRSRLDDDDEYDGDLESRIREELEMAEYNGDLGKKRKLEDLLKDLQNGGDGDDDGGPGGDDNEPDIPGDTDSLPDRPTPQDCIGDIINEDKDQPGYDPNQDQGRLTASRANLNTGSGNTGDGRTPLSADDVEDLLDENGDDDLAELIAMAEYAGDSSAYDDKLRRSLEDLLGDGCMFIYRQYIPDRSNEYISFGVIDKCSRYTHYRYVVDNQDAAIHTLAQISGGSASYIFTMNETSIATNTNEVYYMDKVLVGQTDQLIRGETTTEYPYITESIAEKYLGLSCFYVRGTDYAVLVTESTKKKAEDLYNILVEAEASGDLEELEAEGE